VKYAYLAVALAAITPSASLACDTFDLTFNNGACIQLNGTVLYGYRSGAEVAHTGVRPAPPSNGLVYHIQSPGMTEWRFVAATNYSDRPENADQVMIDTGKRAMKATYKT
jgi:hypothetical protein